MSIRHLAGTLFMLLAVFATGCCCHKHHRHCSPCAAHSSCYSSPASRTETPSFIQIPSPVLKSER